MKSIKTLFLILFVSVCSIPAQAQVFISNWYDLDYIRNDLTTVYILENDLDENTAGYSSLASSSANSGKGWAPIGSSSNRFTGTFKGNGYTISGLYVNRDIDEAGLFAAIGSGGEVLNVGLIDADIASTTGLAGGIAGINWGGTISGCSVSGSISGYWYTGGLVGSNIFSGVITTSYSTGSVTVDQQNAGGLVGYNDAKIENTYSTSSVTADSAAGGLVGSNKDTVLVSYSIGSVSANEHEGGFAGANSGVITDSYWNSTTSGLNSGVGFDDNSQTVTGLDSAAMLDTTNFAGFDFDSVWGFDSFSYPFLSGISVTPYPGLVFDGGSGTQVDPYLISNLNQLQTMSTKPARHYKLTNDIDASDTRNWNSGKGFEPIGNTDNHFTGSIDGDGYTIDSLYINRPETTYGVGFVGYAVFGDVWNIKLTNADVTGDNYVGIIVGALLQSDLENAFASGNVTGSRAVGGLVGDLTFYQTDPKKSLISGCYANVSVTATGYGEAGGIVGSMFTGVLEDCFSTGLVSGNQEVGGIAGFLSSATLRRSYTAAHVEGNTTDIGPIVGNPSTVSGSYNYWYTLSTGLTDSTVGTELSLMEMKSDSTYNGFDFENIWDIYEGFSTPFLRSIGDHRTNITTITGPEGWRMMSSPIEGISYGLLLKDLWTQGFTGADDEGGASNVYTWDETTQQFESITNASDTPEAGKGFIVYVFDDQDNDQSADGFPKSLLIEGNEMEAAASPTLSYTDTGDSNSDGWNLVGNPYAFPLNWAAASGWTHTNIDASFYVWNASAGEYQSHNGITGTLPDSSIAPGQGFWVKANASGPVLSLTHDVRGGTGVLLKKAPTTKLQFALSSGAFTSKTILMFTHQAQQGKDVFDAYKIQSLNGEYLSLFTLLNDGSALDINSLPSGLDEPVEIPIDMRSSASVPANMNLSWSTEHLPDGWNYILIDHATGKEINLRKEPGYVFERQAENKRIVSTIDTTVTEPLHQIPIPRILKAKASTGTRFTLRIVPGIAVSNENESELPRSVQLDQNYPNPFNPTTTINFALPQASNVRLQVFDLLGREVATLVNGQQASGRHSITFDARRLSSGVYIYRLQVAGAVLTRKLTLIK